MRNAVTRPLASLAALVLFLAAGCTNYQGIVRHDDAPLFADEARTVVIARMQKLDDVYLGHSAPEGDPIPAKWRGLKGWVNTADLRIFAYPNNDYARYHAVAFNRREVVLEGKDWPPEVKQAIRENRIQNGMTKEMVELAWGRPASVRPLAGGGEEWVYERAETEVHEDVAWYGYPGGSAFYYAYPYGWGYVYEFPYYEPVYYRTYYTRVRRSSATFNAEGILTGWDARGY
jgi:hypothetical protein